GIDVGAGHLEPSEQLAQISGHVHLPDGASDDSVLDDMTAQPEREIASRAVSVPAKPGGDVDALPHLRDQFLQRKVAGAYRYVGRTARGRLHIGLAPV